MKRDKIIKNIKKILMTILGLFWFSSAVYYLSDWPTLIILLEIANGLIFLMFAYILVDHKLFKLVEIIFLLLNVLLTLTDQVGVIDIIYLVILLIVIYLYILLQKGNKILKKGKYYDI